MSRNIFTCRRGCYGKVHCVFKLFNRDEDQNLEENKCLRKGTKGHDHYKVFPEFNSDGSIVTQQPDNKLPATHVFGKTIIEENIKNKGEDGLTFSPRRFSSEDHPLYHKEERNLPVQSHIDEETVCEIMGGNNPALVVPLWQAETWYGDPKVEVCQEVIYGRLDLTTDMVLPVFIRSYVNEFPDWINYTGVQEGPKKEFFLETASLKETQDVCLKHFSDKIAERVFDALWMIKHNFFVNLGTLLSNNHVPADKRKEFLNKISIRLKKNIFKPSLSIQTVCEYYNCIDKMEWDNRVKVVGGGIRTIHRKLPKELKATYKKNILNWILNHPSLTTDFSDKTRFRKHERLWFAIPLIKNAIKEGLLEKTDGAPESILAIEKADKEFSYLNKESIRYSEASKEVKEEFLDSIIMRCSPDRLYPGMVTVKSFLKPTLGPMAWSIFCSILQAGIRWTMGEVRMTYEQFTKAFLENDPSLFWDWIEKVRRLPYESIYTVSTQEHNEQVRKVNGKKLDVPRIETIEVGISELCPDGYVSPSRAFAENLYSAAVDATTWELCPAPISNYYDATARVKKHRECLHETFWNQLAKVGMAKDRKEIGHLFSKSTLEEAINHATLMDDDVNNQETDLDDAPIDEPDGTEEDPWEEV